MKLSALSEAIGAQLHGPDQDFSILATDSRKIEGGELFVAIIGEQFNGHDFIEQAIVKGAKAVMANRAPTSDEKRVTFLQVKDTIAALGQLAAYQRSLYQLPVVGITGSNGKTTVKGMLESICQLQGKTLANKGNLNNHIGLPLTLMHLDETYQYAVIEMGASAVGEIRYLGQIARPNIALITTIKPSHLIGFGSIERIVEAKGEIYEALPLDGIAILNVDEPYCAHWRAKIGQRKTITFGLKKKAMIYAMEIALAPFHSECILHLPNGEHRLHIPIPGMHMVMNALAASAAAFALGISIETIAEGIKNFQGTARRLRRYQGVNGACVIDDSYNANPGSMQAAIDVLSGFTGERLFIIGDMMDLGPDSSQYHTEIGQIAKQKGIEKLLAVGKMSEFAVKAFGEGAKSFQDKQSLINEVKPLLNSQTVLLVKGSLSTGMDVVTKALIVGEN